LPEGNHTVEATTFFASSPEEPTQVSASNAIARLIDGLGYRLYWGMKGLREEDCSYRLCEGAKSIHDIIWHTLGLVNWVYMHVHGHQMKRPKNIIEQGLETLGALEQLRQHFIEIDAAA
jgi:hypothetical protein